MADVKTILRELSVILGYIFAKYKIKFAENLINVKTYVDFIKKYCKNVDEDNPEIKKFEEIPDLTIHKDIIENGMKLGKLLFEKVKLDGDIFWLSSKVHLEYPFDIKIGNVDISLKENSLILKNPSLFSYLNALIQPDIPSKKEQSIFKSRHKIRYTVLDDVEQTVVVIEDGGLATAHFNEEFIVVNWYSLKIPQKFNDDNIEETIWEYLDSGYRSWKEFHSKQEVDEEVITFMLHQLYDDAEFEKDDDAECFCEEDLKNFLYKN